MWEELNKTLESFRTGNSRLPSPSITLLQIVESALIAVVVHHSQSRIRSGAILEVLLDMDSFQLGEYMDTLAEIPRDEFLRTVSEGISDPEPAEFWKNDPEEY